MLKPYRPVTAFGYALALWLIGFLWGMVVFMVPALRNIPPIPSVSKLPAVSAPLILVYAGLLVFLTKKYLCRTEQKVAEAVKFGISLVVVTVILDTLVYVLRFESYDYFTYASIWFAYGLLLIIPWLVSKKL